MKIFSSIHLLLLGFVFLPQALFAAIEADVACCYAPSYAASVGGDDNAQVLLANAVIGNNFVNDQSGTGAHMRIAGYHQSTNDPINATTTGGMVGWLASDARLSDVRNFGTAVGADLITYACQNSDSASIAAVANQPGMYSALNPGAVWFVVFAHEVGGHNYGRSHSDGVPNPKTIMLHNYCSGGGGAAPPYFYSNPNIWFNGIQLAGDGNNNCSMGTLVNGGDNSAPSAQAVADRTARIVFAPNLNNVVLHWSFTNAAVAAPAGTTNYDLASGAPAVVRGIGAVYTGNALRIPGGTTGNAAANSISAYIDLPNGIISSHTNITIEIWATPLSAPNWARILDFGRPTQAGDGLGAPGEYTGTPGSAAPGTTSSSDDIMLSADVGTDITQQRFEAKLNGTAVTLDAGLATAVGVQHHYAITFADGTGAAGSAGGRWQWYRDGDAIAFLDVSNHLADIEDVNNWLGRSMWSGDNMANNDYAEVRISDTALSRNQVVANFLLGPNYVPTATATMTNSDALGTTSFNAAGQWSNASAPVNGSNYETYGFSLRTPANSTAAIFAGNSLKLSGGSLLWKGTTSSSVTISNLTLNNGLVVNAGSGTCTLAGGLTPTTNGGTFSGANGPFTVNANISGNGPLTFLASATTLSGNNGSYTGKLFIGNGQAGTVAIDSQARLGASPTNFTANQLTLNRGTLQTTATFSLNDTNRGILLDVSGGSFNVAAGTTLTLASTLSSPVMPANVVAGSLTKAGAGSLILNSPSNSFKGTLYVDTSSTSANDGVVKIASSQVLANAHSPIFIRNNNNGGSTLQLDGAGGNITLPQGFAVNCRATTTATIQNVSGTNTLSGFIALNSGGNLFNLQSDTGLLVIKGTNQYVGALTGGRVYAFSGAGDFVVSGPILNSTNGAPISLTKTGTGFLTLAATNTYGGTTTVSGGTMAVNGVLDTNSVTVTASTLSGIGKILGAVTIQGGATLIPGNAASRTIGRLTISNSLTLSSGSFTRVKISKTGSVTTNDLITGLTSLTCAGTITVTNIGNADLVAGDTFKLFSSASYSGGFTTTNLPLLTGNLYWTNRLAVDGTLAVVSPVSTTPVNLAVDATGTSLSLSWQPDHTGWRLLMQTGSLASGLSPDSNDWMTVLGSSSTNQVIVPFELMPPAGFYKLVYP